MIVALSSVAGCSGGMNDSGGSNGYGFNGSGGNNGRGGSAGSGKSGAPLPRAYIGLFGDNAVAVVDTDASKVVATIPVSAPDGLVVTPDGAKLYVSSNNGHVVDVINPATESVEKTIEVGTQPAGLSISGDGRYVVVSVQGDGQAAIIDTGTDTVIAESPVGKAHNSGISANGTRAYIASQVADAPSVQVVDIPSGKPGPDLALDATPRALCEFRSALYATVAGSADIEVLGETSGRKTMSITTAGSPHDVRPTVDGAFVLTVSQTAGELELIDPMTSSVVARVPTGKMPHWIGLSSDGAFAYVTNEGDNNLVLVDLAARTVKKTIAVGNAPRKVAVAP